MATQPDRKIGTFRQHRTRLEGERCPLCDQLLPHDLSVDELQARLQKQEQEAAKAREKSLRQQFAAELTVKVEQTRKEAQAQAAQRENEIRAEAKSAAANELKNSIAKAEKAKTKAEQEKQAAQVQIKQLKAAQEKQIKLEIGRALTEQREALEADNAQAIQKAQAEEFKKNQRLQKQVDLLKRQLEQKTAETLGEGAEIDLFEALREHFDDDKINRVKKGQPGADIIHEVRHNGQGCGSIIYDSKNHGAWRESFLQKLKTDQIAARADHALLITSAFPAGMHQIHVRNGIILANPARAIEIVRILREHILQTHRLRMSGKEKSLKTEALYKFINSDRCRQLLGRYEFITEELLAIDVKEVNAHNLVWKKRGNLLREAQKLQSDYRSEIDRIIEGVVEDE